MGQRLWHALAITCGLYVLFIFQSLESGSALLQKAQPTPDFHEMLARILP